MELLTAEEVAAILKTSPWFVYNNRSLLGGIKIKGVVRFEKSIVMEVLNGLLSTSREMALRFSEERSEVHGQRVRNEAGSEGSGGGSKKKNRNDQYGLLEALHQKT
jgi:hypothetical protein